MKRKIRYILTTILIFVMIIVITTYILRYHVKPSQIYSIDSENLFNDGGFENFSQKVVDCCNSNSGKPLISASKSTDSYEGNYSLNITSLNHCACINKQIKNFNNLEMYIISFYYKGDNPSSCIWLEGDNLCLNQLPLNKTNQWQLFKLLMSFDSNVTAVMPHFYASSDGTHPVTNLYDDLEVHRLEQISYQDLLDAESFNDDARQNAPSLVDNNTYVILTKSDNLVHDAELLSDASSQSGFSYYLVTGIPDITLKFPITELVIILILGFIVIRLLFKRTEDELFEDLSKAIRKDVESRIKFHRG